MNDQNLQSQFPDRLIQLCDGRPGLRGGIRVTVQAPPADEIKNQNPKIQNTDPPILDFVSSDDTLDRYQEIITPAGWQLASYQRNPVFQNAHQYGDIIFTLGKALITEVRHGAPNSPHSALRTPHLYQRIQFATDINPMARIAYGLYSGKFLNAVSVGFIPIRWEQGTPDSCFRRKYLEQELLEVSAVGIPANPNALALAYKSGALAKSDLQETIDLLRQLTATSAPAISPISPISPILSLARELRNLLRR